MTRFMYRVHDTDRAADWRDRAACAKPGVDPDLFDASERELGKIDEAKKVCNRCPVRTECLTGAYTDDEAATIRGGLTRRQRMHYLRRHNGDTTAAVTEALTDEAVLAQRIYHLNTKRVGAHTQWTGAHTISVRENVYTHRQLAFLAHHGTPAEGIVRTRCDLPHCVAKDCLTDARIRRTAA